MSEELAEEALISHQGTGSENSGSPPIHVGDSSFESVDERPGVLFASISGHGVSITMEGVRANNTNPDFLTDVAHADKICSLRFWKSRSSDLLS
jgi:hypothetical protein